MRRKLPTLGVALLVGIVSSVALADTIELRFMDHAGRSISGVPVAVMDEDGQPMAKLLGSSHNGTYMLEAQPLQKLNFEIKSNFIYPNTVEFKIPQHSLGVIDVMVADFTGTGTPPANDECSASVPAAVPSGTLGTTTDATIDDTFPFCGTGITSPGVWYEFVGTGNTVNLSLCNGVTNYDSKISVYCLDCEEPACVGGNDDGGGDCALQSQVSVCTEAGSTYRVLVHGFGGETGDFQLDITDDGASCTSEVICSASGGCCDCSAAPFNCDVRTEADCEARGGDYAGDDTECFPSAGMPMSYISMPMAPIPDDDPAGLDDTISVADTFVIGDVNVDLVVDHTWIGDLVVTLTHPSGESVVVWNRACSLSVGLSVTFDDGGDAVNCASPTTGTITPESAGGGSLGAFNGLVASGDWTLNVSDNAPADTGILEGWGLSIDGEGEAACPEQNGENCFLCPTDPGGPGPDDEDDDEDDDESSDAAAEDQGRETDTTRGSASFGQ